MYSCNVIDFPVIGPTDIEAILTPTDVAIEHIENEKFCY